jgi:peptidoglycan hydrolase-like protein with peptidoglycan-binding domain
MRQVGMAAGSKIDANQDGLRGTLPQGTRLRNYELISVLGQGGFGITYYARDTTLGREVAVKEYLPTSLALREDGSLVVPRSTQHAEDFIWGRERFLDEARTLATLEGVPAVVRVYDFLEANGTAYMVMGLARGDTLEQRLKRDKQLAPPIIEQILERLLDGLEEVHKAGFLHRDIKPANIILDANDDPTLIDFGASRASVADRTQGMTAVFTPRYAAAEQLTSDRQGPYTDIYSISATLYHAITGRPPPSSLERALNDTYKPLAELAPQGFSPALLEMIDAGLAVRANDRPQTIAAWRGSRLPATPVVDDATIVSTGRKTSREAKRSSRPVPPPAARPAPTGGLIAAGKGRTALIGGAAVFAVLVLAAGGYWAFSPKATLVSVPQQNAEAEARQKAEADAQAQKAAAEAQQRAQAEASRKAEAEAQQKAAEARQKEEADTRQKAAVEAQQRAATEAQQRAVAEAQQKAAAEAQQRAQADARQKAEADARQKAAIEAQQKAAAEAEVRQRAETEARQRAEADAASQAARQKTAEADETALRLTQADRQRIQVALTALGFDTRGADGIFGPRSREMILGWQQARKLPATGFLIATQQQTLLREAAPALARFDDEQKKAADDAAKARAAAPVPPPAPAPATASAPAATPVPATASRSDKAYCAELTHLFRRYVQNAQGRKVDVEALTAIEDCEKGNTAAGIPALEKRVTRSGLTLPSR